MRRNTARVMLFSATVGVVSCALAGIVAYSWLFNKADELRAAQPAKMNLAKVVIAKEDLRFGAKLSPSMLKVVEWPAESFPAGGFRSISEVFRGIDARVVLAAMNANEPLLESKVTGPGQRASLSAMLGPGMRAASIRVNEVVGVSGFVLPGDHVDVLLTRTEKKQSGGNSQSGGNTNSGAANAAENSYTDLVLQKVRVLAIDQSPDAKADAPKLARTITVEVSLADAQKLSLAASVGNLTLILRETYSRAGNDDHRRIEVSDLSGENLGQSRVIPAAAIADDDPNLIPDVKQVPKAAPKRRSAKAKVQIVRATETTEYSVERADRGQ